jgi:hypothetical protein
MAETTTTPRILIDQPWDGYAETLGWVEATVTEDQARDALTEFCMTEDGEMGYRPTGPAKREWLMLEEPKPNAEDEMWVEAPANGPGAVEFWAIVVA